MTTSSSSSSPASASAASASPAASAPKTNLSHILSASAACHILGQDVVRPIIRSFLRYVASPANDVGGGGVGLGVGGRGGG
eukprot:CAMPEP_0197458768 /NCGR_PEP_ID=MMETSP1175-20131217/49559_1 /TAXON_ID=1003142 /ORGANISM="Triceratium dubium, Strain CCMP147" /LENGTH=80 /DNA_ID=CAMNT_0042993481 /DNA_START=10 /DNA_END=248 /DNA_ORIENTATION=+